MRVVTSKQLDNTYLWDFLAVQWLRHTALTGEGLDSVPGRGTKIPQGRDVKQAFLYPWQAVLRIHIWRGW